MHPIIRNILAFIGGAFVGGVINMGLIKIGMSVIPPPEGVDPMNLTQESIKAFKPINFVFPYLAHALGTLVGAYTTVRIAATRHMTLALGIGAFFLLGGIMMIQMIGGPTWFNALDVLSYLPMAFIGGSMANRVVRKNRHS